MNGKAEQLLQTVLRDNPALLPLEPELRRAVEIACDSFQNGGKLLCCGNGGSAADSEHIVGELMKGFLLKRPLTNSEREAIAQTGCPEPEAFADHLQRGLPAISLVSQSGLFTAFCNDVDPAMVFAQQVFAYGNPGDLLIGLSTSGNSENVVRAAYAAKARGMKVIAFTGEAGGKLASIADITLRAPTRETYRVQEFHLPLYHAFCGCVELQIFGDMGQK